MDTEISSQEVTSQIDHWIVRLNSLYDQLDQWMTSIPHDKIRRGRRRQQIEPLMRLFKIPPRDVPTYTVFQGKSQTAFVPSVLWIAGANGRVNITTSAKEHILVDVAEGKAKCDWQLITENAHRILVPFKKGRFLNLLAESEKERQPNLRQSRFRINKR